MEALLFNFITPQAYIELRSNISNAKRISNGEADFTFIPSVAKATAPLDSQNKGEPLFVVTTLRLEQLETISGRCRGVTEVIR